MDTSFESRVWQRALDRGLLSTRQVNDCLKDSDSSAPTLRLTELLVTKGYLHQEQVAAIRGEIAIAEPEAPDEVRAAAQDPRKLIGRYVAVQELGRGGMGIVYRAWDGDLRRYVALKVLSGPWDDQDLARFRREAQSAAALRHPNIISVFEISTSDETPYITLELIDGRTLDGRKLPPRKASELMVLIARAVEAAHRRGIIHRDLKPQNIMVDQEGRPKVMDFGLARPVVTSSQITMSGTVMGTPAYMSPEQAQGRARELDHRCDIFSLGAVLYELLTGQAPFGGKTPLETLRAVVEQQPTRPRKLNPTIPKPLEAIILTCLHKDKTKRYASAEALARDLERFLKGQAVAARLPRSPAPLIAALGAGLALAVALLAWPSPPRALPALPPAPAPIARPKPADRSRLDLGLELLEQARLDLYRPGASGSQIRAKLQEALLCFDDALSRDPKSGAAYLARGDARARLQRTEEALADYAEAIRLLPTSPAAFLARGRLQLDRYMTEMTIGSWKQLALPEQVQSWRDQARSDFLKAQQLSPTKGESLWLQACLALTDLNEGETIRLATEAIPLAERPEEFHKIRGDALQFRSDRSTDRENQESSARKAVEDYNRAIELRSNYAEAHRFRGAMLWKVGRLDEAQRDFEFLLALNPEDSQALSDLATHHLRAGHKVPALDLFNRAIAADPRNYRALTNRASLHHESGRLAEAQRDLEAALKINPNHAPAIYNLSMARLAVGKPEEALKLIDEVLARSPRFSKALALRGRILHRQGRWKEALEELESALSSDPALEPQLRPMMDDCRRRLGR